ncbi:MAG: SPOR domain-containing protein [Ignavibacteriales bacterium]|nr:SPOR domain-containing protein [Ignavibacteriales bacterium]
MGLHVQKIKQFSLSLTLFLFVIGVSGFYPSGNLSLESDSLQYQPHKEKLSTFERSFKPSFYDTEVYRYKKNDTPKASGIAIDNPTSAQPETLQGFRVQLIATSEYDQAITLRNELNLKYPDLWIYTVYEAPMYKVRAGDFSNRYEAKTLLDKIQTDGYRAAWIVPDKVIKNQPPKPPLPAQIDSTAVQSNIEE